MVTNFAFSEPALILIAINRLVKIKLHKISNTHLSTSKQHYANNIFYRQSSSASEVLPRMCKFWDNQSMGSSFRGRIVLVKWSISINQSVSYDQSASIFFFSIIIKIKHIDDCPLTQIIEKRTNKSHLKVWYRYPIILNFPNDGTFFATWMK